MQLAYTRGGEIIEIVQAVASLLSVFLYITGTYLSPYSTSLPSPTSVISPHLVPSSSLPLIPSHFLVDANITKNEFDLDQIL